LSGPTAASSLRRCGYFGPWAASPRSTVVGIAGLPTDGGTGWSRLMGCSPSARPVPRVDGVAARTPPSRRGGAPVAGVLDGGVRRGVFAFGSAATFGSTGAPRSRLPSWPWPRPTTVGATGCWRRTAVVFAYGRAVPGIARRQGPSTPSWPYRADHRWGYWLWGQDLRYGFGDARLWVVPQPAVAQPPCRRSASTAFYALIRPPPRRVHALGRLARSPCPPAHLRHSPESGVVSVRSPPVRRAPHTRHFEPEAGLREPAPARPQRVERAPTRSGWPIAGAASLAAGALALSVRPRPPGPAPRRPPVLLLSVDGLHQFDLACMVAHHPHSRVGRTGRGGVEFTGAQTPVPSDSFPGLVGQVTGGNPSSTGVYYDDS